MNLILGFIFITGGVLVLSGASQPVITMRDHDNMNRLKGVLASLGGAFCWGISPMLVKLGFSEGASPLQGGFVSYVAASVVMAFSLSHRGNIEKIRKLNRHAMIPIILGSIAVGIAQLFRYFAIEHSPISLVAQIMATSPLFVLSLSFVINRSIEAFSTIIIFGTITTVVGVLLIFRVA
jgi:drug/metabolite transporter (DMT)-like permease